MKIFASDVSVQEGCQVETQGNCRQFLPDGRVRGHICVCSVLEVQSGHINQDQNEDKVANYSVQAKPDLCRNHYLLAVHLQHFILRWKSEITSLAKHFHTVLFAIGFHNRVFFLANKLKCHFSHNSQIPVTLFPDF